MVCPNCQSSEIIAVQGQSFCVGCGKLVTAPRPTIVHAEAAPQPVIITSSHPVTSAEITVRRKPGRPKAPRLDTPLHQAVAVTPETVVAPVVDVPATTITQPAPIAEPVLVTRLAAITFHDVTSVSWRDRFHVAHAVLAFLPALIMSGFLGLALALMLKRPPVHIEHVNHHLVMAVGVEIGLVFLLYYLARSLTQGAIIYGAERRADHRPVGVRKWLAASATSMWARLRLDALYSILKLLIVAAMGGLVWVGERSYGISSNAQLGLLFIAFFVLVYGLVAITLAASLARVGLILGRLRVSHAFGLGWSMLRRHTEIIGLKAFAIMLEAIALLPLAALITAVVILVPVGSPALSAILIALAAVIAGASVGAGSALWWQVAYRKIVNHDKLREAVELLGGRASHLTSEKSFNRVLGAMLLVAILSALWPWLPGWLVPAA